jgi:hypothetical protein
MGGTLNNISYITVFFKEISSSSKTVADVPIGEVKMGQQIRARISKDFLGPKVTKFIYLPFQIWGSAKISMGLGVFLKILSCRIFTKKFLVTFYCFFFQKW